MTPITTTKTTTKTEKKTTTSTTKKLKTSTSSSAIVSTTSSTTSLSITKTDSSLKDKQVETYMNNVLRRLNNFERLLKLKKDKFNEKSISIDAEPRLVFLMTYEDLVKIYMHHADRQKKRKLMNQVTSGFKLAATIALLSLCLFLVYSLYCFKKIMDQIYTKKKIAKEKRKRQAKKKKRRQLLSKL